MVAGDVRAAVHRLAVHARADELGQRRQLGDRLRAGDAVTRDDDRRPGTGEELGGSGDGSRSGPGARGDRRWSDARILHRRAHEVHRQRQEHRARRRRQRDLKRAPQRDRGLLGTPDLVRPLRELLGHADEVAGEDRLVHEKARVLLTRRHQERRLGPRRVVQDREAVREAGRNVDVGDADLSRRLRVAVGRRDRGGFLEPQHVLEPGVGQRVEERQLGRAGVAEEIADPGGSQDLHEDGRDVHAPSILPFESLARSPRAGPQLRDIQRSARPISSAAGSAWPVRSGGTSRRSRPGWPPAACPHPSCASRHA